MKLVRKLLFICFSVFFCNTSSASDQFAQANNPLADMRALNFQNYYYPSISDFSQKGDTFWVRYVQPVGGFIVRASMPFSSYPISANSKKTGSSDFNVFAAYLLDVGDPSVTVGVGPLLVAPTASPTELGAGRWQGGLAAVYFNADSAKIQFGGLLTYQADFAGQKNRNHTSLIALQPFAFFQLGKGYYLRSAPLWVYDLVQNRHVVPLGLGLGKVIRSGNVVYNGFIEPQFAISYKGAGQPQTQIFAGLNLQFY